MRRKVRKVKVELTRAEVRLVIEGMIYFRNTVIRAGGPTEDIDEILLKFMKL